MPGSEPESEVRPIFGAGSIEMTDLSELPGRNIPRLVTLTLSGGLPEPGLHYVNALTRMADRAAYMYEEARAALSAVAAAGRADLPLRQLIHGSDCLEIAVNAILRAHLVGDRVRRLEDMPRIERTELLSNAELQKVRNMRHFAEHLDEYILAGEIGGGGRSGLAFNPRADRIEFAGEIATYVEIGEWITRLEGLARRLLD